MLEELRNMFKTKSFFPKQEIKLDMLVKPDDWLVMSLGQSPLHCLWFCELYNMETKRQIGVEEYDTAQQALEAAIAEIAAQTAKQDKYES